METNTVSETLRKKCIATNNMWKPPKEPPKRQSTSYLFICIFIAILFSLVSSASAITHPTLLFKSIGETPGYKYSTTEPWKTYKSSIISDCSAATMQDCALAYQITGDASYAKTARDALISFTRTAGSGYNDGAIARVRELRMVDFTYDWVQPYLTSADNTAIRLKIAQLADQVYYDLNDGGAQSGYISTVDYHLQAYPQMGIAGLVLSDYSGSLPHGSTPAQWLKVGTTYLFVKDDLHTFGKSMLDFEVDKSGRDLTESYKIYYYDDFYDWFQVYSYYYGHSICNDYPVACKWVMDETVNALPNGYSSNWVTDSNFKWLHGQYFMNLLSAEQKTHMAKFTDALTKQATFSGTCVYTLSESPGKIDVKYLTQQDFSSVAKADLPYTTSISADQTEQVFRKDWTSTSAWLAFTNWNTVLRSNREMAHDDQLSFDFYDKGDYLMPDSGEIRYRSTNVAYGPRYAKGHNVVMVSDTASSNVGGIPKGMTGTLNYPATLKSSVIDSSMEYAESEVARWAEIEKTTANGEETSYADKQTLANPVGWDRGIMYPDKDYFVVFDYVSNTQQRKIYNLFQLGSFQHPDTTSSKAGNVNGKLAVNGASVDWASQAFGTEVDKSTGSQISWDTTNINNQAVQLNLYSVPSSQISVEKYFTRIGGDNLASEVDHPIVRFKTTTSGNLYRITAITTRYSGDTQKSFAPVTVSGGEGSALSITDGTTVDIVYMGSGQSITAGNLATDALKAFARTQNNAFTQLFISSGSTFKFGGIQWFSSPEKVTASLKYSQGKVNGQISGDSAYAVTVKTTFTGTVVSVKYNGQSVPYTESSGLVTVNLAGTGVLEILGPGGTPSTITTTTIGSTTTTTVSKATTSTTKTTTTSQATISTTKPQVTTTLRAGSVTTTTLSGCVANGCGTACQASCNDQYGQGKCGLAGVNACMNTRCNICVSATSTTSTTTTTRTTTTTQVTNPTFGGCVANGCGVPCQRSCYNQYSLGKCNVVGFLDCANTLCSSCIASTSTGTTSGGNAKIYMESVSLSAHAYDNTDPLDGIGDGSGGQGLYMLVGDDRVTGTSDDKYRGIAVFNTSKLACSINSNKTLCLYHYGTIGSSYNYVDVSMLSMSSPLIAGSDYGKPSTIPAFERIDVRNWTDANDAWTCFDITSGWNAAVSGKYPYAGIRLDPQWYANNGKEDAVQISTTGNMSLYVKC